MIAVCILPTLALMDRMSAKDPHLLNHYSFYRVFVEVAWYNPLPFFLSFCFVCENKTNCV